MINGISNEKLLRLYRNLFLARRFDERVQLEFTKAVFGYTVHSLAYQEVTPIVAASLLRKDDYIKLHMRFGICQFAKGVPLKQVAAGEFLKKIDSDKSFEYRDFDLEYGLLGKSGSLGEDIPIYVGAALAEQIKKTDRATVIIMGDGSSNRGPVHEAMNIAAVWKLPVVFSIVSNKYAMSTPLSETTANPRLSDRAIGYGMPGYEVDGNDVLAVYEAFNKAIKMAREGKGPSLIVADTYRIVGHAIGDPQTYRPKGEVEEWIKFDPLPRYKKTLMDNKILTEQEAARIEDEAMAEIDEAVKYALTLPIPEVSDLTAKGIFD